MWTESYYRFPSRKAFLNACEAAGWTRGPANELVAPEGVSFDEIGQLVSTPVMEAATGMITPGDVLDARHYVTIAYHPPAAEHAGFVAHRIEPERPARVFASVNPRRKLTEQRKKFQDRKKANAADPLLAPDLDPKTIPEEPPAE